MSLELAGCRNLAGAIDASDEAGSQTTEDKPPWIALPLARHGTLLKMQKDMKKILGNYEKGAEGGQGDLVTHCRVAQEVVWLDVMEGLVNFPDAIATCPHLK